MSERDVVDWNDIIILTREEVREAREPVLVGEGCFSHDYGCFWWYERKTCLLMGDDNTCFLCKRLTEFAKGEEDDGLL